MQCAVKRWGPGTTIDRPTNSTASKELQERLAKMNIERQEQDSMWKQEQPLTKKEPILIEKNVVIDTRRNK